MAVENRIDQILSPELEAELGELIERMNAILVFALTVTDEDRQDMLKLGDKSLAFVGNTYDALQKFPHLVPPIVSEKRYSNDLTLFRQLSPLLKPLAKVLRMMEDTTMVAGGEAYKAALLTYGYLQKAKDLEPGLTPVLTELGKRFERQGRKKK